MNSGKSLRLKKDLAFNDTTEPAMRQADLDVDLPESDIHRNCGADFDPATLHDWPENLPALESMARQWSMTLAEK